MNYSKLLALTALLSIWVCRSAAQLAISETYNVHRSIPDGDLSGLADHQTIHTSGGPVLDVTVTLHISGIDSGAVNGDLYAYLTHGPTGFAVLLNRPGRNADNSMGYDDNGLSSVTFSDSAANGDLHEYRIRLSGDENAPIAPALSPLTGTWAPDGRNVSPLSSGRVLAETSRSALLSSLNGLDPNGSWTLFIADVATGGMAQLDSWGLTITVVPEPQLATLIAATGLLGFGLIARKRREGRAVRFRGHYPVIFMPCGPIRYRVDAGSQAVARPFTPFASPQTLQKLRAALHDSGVGFHLNEDVF